MLTFFHCPRTRSGSVMWLLEELGVPFELRVIDIFAEGGAPESYRAVQPNKKVPAIVHDGVAVHERAAIFTYLCDAFPAAGLAPRIDDPRRGPYLSWLVYNDAVMDPVIGAKWQNQTYDKRGVSYGAFDDMVANLNDTLSRGPYLTGDTFTAADLLVSGAVNFAINFSKVLPTTEALSGFVERCMSRPAFARAAARDEVPAAGG